MGVAIDKDWKEVAFSKLVIPLIQRLNPLGMATLADICEESPSAFNLVFSNYLFDSLPDYDLNALVSIFVKSDSPLGHDALRKAAVKSTKFTLSLLRLYENSENNLSHEIGLAVKNLVIPSVNSKTFELILKKINSIETALQEEFILRFAELYKTHDKSILDYLFALLTMSENKDFILSVIRYISDNKDSEDELLSYLFRQPESIISIFFKHRIEGLSDWFYSNLESHILSAPKTISLQIIREMADAVLNNPSETHLYTSLLKTLNDSFHTEIPGDLFEDKDKNAGFKRILEDAFLNYLPERRRIIAGQKWSALDNQTLVQAALRMSDGGLLSVIFFWEKLNHDDRRRLIEALPSARPFSTKSRFMFEMRDVISVMSDAPLESRLKIFSMLSEQRRAEYIEYCKANPQHLRNPDELVHLIDIFASDLNPNAVPQSILDQTLSGIPEDILIRVAQGLESLKLRNYFYDIIKKAQNDEAEGTKKRGRIMTTEQIEHLNLSKLALSDSSCAFYVVGNYEDYVTMNTAAKSLALNYIDLLNSVRKYLRHGQRIKEDDHGENVLEAACLAVSQLGSELFNNNNISDYLYDIFRYCSLNESLEGKRVGFFIKAYDLLKNKIKENKLRNNSFRANNINKGLGQFI